MISDHAFRSLIFTQVQHPFKHVLSDFGYSNEAVPGVGDVEGAIDYIFAVIYPNFQGTVPTPADLPLPGTINHMYRVEDDGDGRTASYVFQRIDGIEQYIKRYDIDWAADTILSDTITRTQFLYVSRFGETDRDENGDDFTGDLAGQRIYGGNQAGQHLILYSNSGDTVGATGFVQFGDNARPLTDDTFTMGQPTYRFTTGYFSQSLIVDSLTIAPALITDTTGTISFGDENLVTTGVFTVNAINLSSYLEMTHIATPANASVGTSRLYFKSDTLLYRLDEAGNERLVGLSFTSANDNRLVRSDGVSGTAIQESIVSLDDAGQMTGLTLLGVDSVQIDGQTISTTTLNSNLILAPNGTGIVELPGVQDSSLTQDRLLNVNASNRVVSTGIVITGNALSAIESLDVDNININANTISSTDVNGNVVLSPNGTGVLELTALLRPDTDDSYDIGESALRFQDLFLSGTISDGTNAIAMATLLSFRDALVGAANGASLFYNNVSGLWEANIPDTEIDHGQISGLLDDDHTQYALLAGRTGGQTLIGGVLANNDLILESTSDATKGFVKTSSDFVPTVTASFAAGWLGTDLGNAAFTFRDVHTKGEFFGFRFENTTFAGIPSPSVQNTGRAVWATDVDAAYVDTGGAWKQIGRSVFRSDISFNGSETLKDVDVSASLGDARNAIIQLLDNNNDFERIIAKVTATSATNVRIETNLALPAGAYRLIAIE